MLKQLADFVGRLIDILDDALDVLPDDVDTDEPIPYTLTEVAA